MILEHIVRVHCFFAPGRLLLRCRVHHLVLLMLLAKAFLSKGATSGTILNELDSLLRLEKIWIILVLKQLLGLLMLILDVLILF